MPVVSITWYLIPWNLVSSSCWPWESHRPTGDYYCILQYTIISFYAACKVNVDFKSIGRTDQVFRSNFNKLKRLISLNDLVNIPVVVIE